MLWEKNHLKGIYTNLLYHFSVLFSVLVRLLLFRCEKGGVGLLLFGRPKGVQVVGLHYSYELN